MSSHLNVIKPKKRALDGIAALNGDKTPKSEYHKQKEESFLNQ
ncbi:hypothetical protein [Legionella sainthelensi]|nr:hypothetical protein [Legionella sainthelensi]